jgi:hypothetical protein
MRHRGPRLARRHPNGESEGILEGPTPKVRPDLRRDMVGIPEISGPQERERDVEHTTQREHLHHGGATVPSGEPGSWDKNELREREREREITALHTRRTHQGREDLVGRLARGGWQLEVHWGGGTSL